MNYDLERYCTDTFVEIPKPEWLPLVEEPRKDDAKKQALAEHLADLVGKYPAPCPPVPEKYRKNDFYHFLKYEDEEVESNARFRSHYSYPVSDVTWKWSRLGCRFVNSFFQYNRICAGHRSNPSLVEAWATRERRISIMRAAITLKKHLNLVTAYEAASMKINVASNFRPTAARQVYNAYGNEGTVLDFSSGFGGRFFGFYGSRCKHYIGIDPNSALRQPYQDMFDWLAAERPTDQAHDMIWLPAEDVDYSPWHGKVDLVFTSPPYFNLERYSSEETQSWVRYPDVERWLKHFLFDVVEKVTPCVKSGGHLVINIADSETYKDVQILERLCHFAQAMGFKAMPAKKYLLSFKPGDNNTKKNVGMGKLAEPILVFRK